MTNETAIQTLYEQDFNLWIEDTVKKLRDHSFNKLDLENLIEEIESMGRSEKNALESNLTILLMHLLKWQYQPSKRSNSWAFSITEHAIRINKAFKNSPSLKPYYEQIFDECYVDARKLAARDTGLSIDVFPPDCPFQKEDVINPDYLPD